MAKLRHSTLIFISGFIWLSMGLWLFAKGIRFLVESSKTLEMLDKTLFLKNYDLQTAQAIALAALAAALFIGYAKARFILSKTAVRVMKNVLESKNPAPISSAFSKKYLILIGLMGAIGMTINFTGMPLDVRGFIDTAIGASLINGSVLFLKSFVRVRQEEKEKLFHYL